MEKQSLLYLNLHFVEEEEDSPAKLDSVFNLIFYACLVSVLLSFLVVMALKHLMCCSF